MLGDTDIGGHSRSFRIAVVVTAVLVLFAAMLAVSAIADPPESGGGGGGDGTPGVPDGSVGFPNVSPGEVDVSPGGGGGGGSGSPPLDGVGDIPIQQVWPGGDGNFTGDLNWSENGDFNLSENGDFNLSGEGDANWDGQFDPGILDGDFSESEFDPQNLSELQESGFEVPPPPYNITVEPQPTPGANVTVTVKKEGEAVPGAAVAFNGRPVGVTDWEGNLESSVPYTEELTVTARPIELDFDESDRQSVAAGSTGTETWLGGPNTDATALTLQPESNSSVSYDVLTDVTAESDAVGLPGQTVPIQFTIDGRPVPQVDVVVNGERVAVTDENGTAEIPIPADREPGDEVRVLLQRGEFNGAATVEVGDIELTVETGLFAFPRTTAEATVRAVDSDGKQSVANAPVTIREDGQLIAEGTTDENGVVTFTLPWSNSVTASTSVDDLSASGSATGMLYDALGLFVFLALCLAGLLVVLVRNTDKLNRAKALFVDALLTGGKLLRRAGNRVYQGVISVANAINRWLARLWEGVTLALVLAPLVWVYRRLRGAVLWVYRRLRSAVLWIVGQSADDNDESEDTETTTTLDEKRATGTQQRASAHGRLRRYWHWFVKQVVGRSPTKTAVEVENQAVEKGLPRKPVRRLRRAFQDVEYGFADAEDRVETAESAVDHLRSDDEEAE